MKHLLSAVFRSVDTVEVVVFDDETNTVKQMLLNIDIVANAE